MYKCGYKLKDNPLIQLGIIMKYFSSLNYPFFLFLFFLSFVVISVIAGEPADTKNTANSDTAPMVSPIHDVQNAKLKQEDASLLTPVMPAKAANTNSRTDVSSVKTVVKSIKKQKAAEIKHINSSKQFTTLLKTKTPVLVDFCADWSAPCDMINDAMDNMLKKADGKYIVAKMGTVKNCK